MMFIVELYVYLTAPFSEIKMLYIKQAYLVKKLQKDYSSVSYLPSLQTIQRLIKEWFFNYSKHIQTQTRRKEFQEGEQTRIYRHELHKRYLSKSSIVKLAIKLNH